MSRFCYDHYYILKTISTWAKRLGGINLKKRIRDKLCVKSIVMSFFGFLMTWSLSTKNNKNIADIAGFVAHKG